jgi:hypothetical protein
MPPTATSIEFWTHARTLPRLVGPAARRAEAEGWSGVTPGDSQNMSGDPFVAFGTVAAATTTIKLSTGVTNPYTRHPAVTADDVHVMSHLMVASQRATRDRGGVVVFVRTRGRSRRELVGRAHDQSRADTRHRCAIGLARCEHETTGCRRRGLR